VRLVQRVRPPSPGPARRPVGLTRAVVGKDARQVARDWSVLGDVVTSSLMWAALPLVGSPLWGGASGLTLTGAVVVLACGLGYEVAARSVPLERQGLALLLISPAPPGRWLAAKLCGSALLSAAIYLAAGGALALGLGVDRGPALESLAWGGLALATAVCLGLALGVRYGDFAWTNPRAMLHAGGRALAAAALVTQVTVWVGLYWWTAAGGGAPAARWPLGMVAALAACAALLHSTVRRLRSYDWQG
jgi:hypothetical protein